LAQKLKELEYKIGTHDEQITAIFEAINQLLTPHPAPKRKIGFEENEKLRASLWVKDTPYDYTRVENICHF
jgi:hypothetical protein